MTTYVMGLSADHKTLFVAAQGDALPGGATNIGSFDHLEDDDNLGPLENHVIFHHARDALYHRSESDGSAGAKFPKNITNMQSLNIVKHGARINVDFIRVTPTEATIEPEATQQLTAAAFTDNTTTNVPFTWTSSDPEVATVNNAGLVTAVAPGEATITARSAVTTGKAKITVSDAE